MAINIGNQANTFVVNGNCQTPSILVDDKGNTIISKLVLLDDKTGRKWEVKISDGQLCVEPLEIEDKRDFKINKILK